MSASDGLAGWRLALLNFSAWVRRQSTFQAVYRQFPQSLRDAVSQQLAAPATARLHFAKTDRWAAGLRAGETAESRSINRRFGAAGVNVFAFFRGQLGLGESARMYTRALMGEGFPVALNDISLDSHAQDDASLHQHLGDTAPFPVNLIFVNPDYFTQALAAVTEARAEGRRTIACWFWELENFPPEWLPALDSVDEIMVASTFVQEMIQRVTAKPVFCVPLPLSDPGDSGLIRSDFGLDSDAFVFLHSFDFASFIKRKNPLAVIDAFRRAFPERMDTPILLLKTSNGHRYPEQLRALLNAAAGDPRIIVRDDIIDRRHLHALQRCCDVFVSLHRGEGFGLGLAECMRLGKPVIGTNWSGNLEFMTATNSCLVDYTLVDVEPGDYMHWQGQRWAEPDLDSAAGHMRQLFDDRELAASIGRNAASDVRAALSPTVAAGLLAGHIIALAAAQPTNNISPWPTTMARPEV